MSASTLPPPTRSTGWADLAVRSLGPSRGWRPALRMALRDLRRHPGRTAAAAVMVLVPVLLASALAVVLATTDVSRQDELLARMAAADALVSYDGTLSGPEQDWRAPEVAALVGTAVVEVRRGGGLPVQAGDEQARAGYLAADLANPVTDGLVDVLTGRLPRTGAEVALSPGLARDLGVVVGEQVTVPGGTGVVTGLAVERWTSPGVPLVVVTPGSLATVPEDRPATTWLVDGQPATWELDPASTGLSVVGRPDVGRDDGQGLRGLGALAGDMAIVVVVGITLVVLEIALLAGPAFAVGVRQQQRTLALLAATGGDARALRRVVLAQALVVGAASAALGAVVGVGSAALVMRVLRYRVDAAIGPVEVLWSLVLVFVGIGVVASLASALVPALTASRASVVAALAARRSERRVPWRRPLLGLGLVSAGTLLLAAATAGSTGDSAISGSLAILLLGVGMVLLVPLPVALLARLTTRAPLGLRLAGRESTRAATRSVAAVAAVAGASAALVAGLSLTAAVRAEDEARYVPRSAYGVTTVYESGDVRAVQDRVERALPGATTAVGGDVRFIWRENGGSSTSFWLPTADCPQAPSEEDRLEDPCWTSWLADTAGSVEQHDPVGAQLRGLDLTAEQQSVLDAGGALVSDELAVTTEGGRLPVAAITETWDADGATEVAAKAATTVPVATFRWPEGRLSAADPPVLVMSPGAAAALDLAPPPDVLLLPPGIDASSTPAQVHDAVRPALTSLRSASDSGFVHTEVGYRDTLRVVDWLVVGAAALVLLGATFTATALALADARRDRTVLTAVGASPRTQRTAAGGTAALIAGTGALVGGLVGFVPGFVVGRAVLEPSVVSYGLGIADGPDLTQSLLAVLPWGWFAVVLVGLPLLAGAVVALVARGRPDAEAARLSARVG